MIKSRALWPAEYGAPAVRNHPMTSTERWTSSLRGEKCRVKPACTSENQGWVERSRESGEIEEKYNIIQCLIQHYKTKHPHWQQTLGCTPSSHLRMLLPSRPGSHKPNFCGWSSSTYHPLIISTSPDSAGPLRCCTSPVIRRESWVCLGVVSNLFRLHPSGPPNKKSLVFSFHTILLAHLVFVHHFWGLTRRKERRQQTNTTEMQTCER